MAMAMDFEDDCDVFHPAAHWRLTQLNVATIEATIRISFFAYKDLAAFQAGKQPLAGGRKDYVVVGDDYLLVATETPDGATIYEVLANASEKYALGKLDTPSGEVDAEGNPILVSFFDGATEL